MPPGIAAFHIELPESSIGCLLHTSDHGSSFCAYAVNPVFLRASDSPRNPAISPVIRLKKSGFPIGRIPCVLQLSYESLGLLSQSLLSLRPKHFVWISFRNFNIVVFEQVAAALKSKPPLIGACKYICCMTAFSPCRCAADSLYFLCFPTYQRFDFIIRSYHPAVRQ